MSDPKQSKLLRTKSFSSLYDVVGAHTSTGNLVHKVSPNKQAREHAMYVAKCQSPTNIPPDYEYVVSEKYNPLIKESSTKVIIPSTSTIFCDLDEIAKRHSFHCFTEPCWSNANFLKVMRLPQPINVFGEKATAIVQECATQMHAKPKLLPRDSIEVNSKKVKKKKSGLSSEILLRDDDYTYDYQKTRHYKHSSKLKSNRPQKFWSYSKYRTEYTKPIPEEKKAKKKDRGKRTEDPCPCQLFSYACPCTNKKSLTKLAKNSKSLTIVDQVTSTDQVVAEQKQDVRNSKVKKCKRDFVMEDKPTNTSIIKMIEVTVPNKKNDEPIELAPKKDVPIVADKNNFNTDKTAKNKLKPPKKARRIFCPNCKEKVDVVISTSTTEEEESLKYEHSSVFHSKEISSTTAYRAASASPNCNRSKNTDDGDLCLHDPRCEMLPVCQILPTDFNFNLNQKCANKNTNPKSTAPRVIRITKACRHHPPCTVVPSCQRATVLKNNCEYIPPCLHRPRCVNLPLCVPLSKNLHYEEATNKMVEDIETTTCPHIPRCKYVPVCQHDSLANTINQQVNMITRVQNACEFLNDYNVPPFLLNQNQPTRGTFSPSPCQLTPNNTCYTEQFTCRSNKSCQFDSSNYNTNDANENSNDETVIFIRDVGCQFRNKKITAKESVLPSKVSSNSLDFVDVKMGNYYTNVHTLRYEDKCTNPLSGGDQSFSTMSILSMERESECPSHGRRLWRGSRTRRPTGFAPRSAYITAFSSVTQQQLTQLEDCNKSDLTLTFPVKSRRHFQKGKYRKMYSLKRKRKSRIQSNLVLNSSVLEPTNKTD